MFRPVYRKACPSPFLSLTRSLLLPPPLLACVSARSRVHGSAQPTRTANVDFSIFAAAASERPCTREDAKSCRVPRHSISTSLSRALFASPPPLPNENLLVLGVNCFCCCLWLCSRGRLGGVVCISVFPRIRSRAGAAPLDLHVPVLPPPFSPLPLSVVPRALVVWFAPRVPWRRRCTGLRRPPLLLHLSGSHFSKPLPPLPLTSPRPPPYPREDGCGVGVRLVDDCLWLIWWAST